MKLFQKPIKEILRETILILIYRPSNYFNKLNGKIFQCCLLMKMILEVFLFLAIFFILILNIFYIAIYRLFVRIP
jgi:hypothetical protein